MSRKIYLDLDWDFLLPEHKNIVYYHDTIGNEIITHGKFKNREDVSHRYFEYVIELQFYGKSDTFVLSKKDDVCMLYIIIP